MWNTTTRLSRPRRRRICTLRSTSRWIRPRASSAITRIDCGTINTRMHQGSEPMKLLDFVVPEAIVADLKARTKEEAIPEIIDALVASGAITEEQREEFIALIRDREKRATTGLGHGVATPHAKHTDIKQIKAAVAVSHHGVEFNALDRQPVF